MIEFGLAKSGWPWHGLWRAATGKITAAGGIEIDYVGASPLSGDVQLVRIPGLPEPETTTAEAAAGMQWTNWALVSGSQRVVYGHSMPGHIYVAPNGSLWVCGISTSGTRASGQLGAGLTFRRFGELVPENSESLAAFYQTLGKTVSFSINPDSPDDVIEGGRAILDVSVNGNRVLIAGVRAPGMWSPTVDRRCYVVAEIVISGTPGIDVDFTFAKLSDEGADEAWGIDTYEIHGDEMEARWSWQPAAFVAAPSGAPASPSENTAYEFGGVDYRWQAAGGWFNMIHVESVFEAALASAERKIVIFDPYRQRRVTLEKRWVVGARYELGLPKLITCRYSARDDEDLPTITSSVPGDVPVSTLSKPSEVTGMSFGVAADYVRNRGIQVSVSLWSGATKISEQTFSRTATIRNRALFHAPAPRKLEGAEVITTAGGQTFTWSFSLAASPGGSNQIAWNMYGYFLLAGCGARLSNSIYTTRIARYDNTNGGTAWPIPGYHSGAAVGAVGFDATVETFTTDSVSGYKQHATEHPVTWQVVRSATPVCWV